MAYRVVQCYIGWCSGVCSGIVVYRVMYWCIEWYTGGKVVCRMI